MTSRRAAALGASLAVLISGLWAARAGGADATNPPAAAPGHAGLSFREVRNCATCHAAQAKLHPATSMAHALETVEECSILREHPLLTFSANGYSYRIERKGDKSFYTVSDGKDALTLPIGWAFGLGTAGQTYVLEKDGAYYESFVSYYKAPAALDITMGDQSAKPATLLEAAGRLMGSRETLACFNCHSTHSVEGTHLTLDSMVPGVQCERCHGDAAKHLAGLKSGDASSFAMKKLSALTTEETSVLCGQCHRTWDQIAMNGPHGVLNVRFQPYRLTNSRCYDVDDKRIACTSCHDPHREIDRVSTDYDVKCQACHAGGKAQARTCTVGTRDCASCHMPKIELPGSHHKFSDHDIRVVRAGAPYPE